MTRSLEPSHSTVSAFILMAALLVSLCSPAKAARVSSEFEAVIGEPEVARVSFSERPGGALVTFFDDGAPTGPSSGRYRLVVGVAETCDSKAGPIAYNPLHVTHAPGVLPPLSIVDGPGVDGGTVGVTHYAQFVRGLDMHGRYSVANHALYLIEVKSGDFTCTTIHDDGPAVASP